MQNAALGCQAQAHVRADEILIGFLCGLFQKSVIDFYISNSINKRWSVSTFWSHYVCWEGNPTRVQIGSSPLTANSSPWGGTSENLPHWPLLSWLTTSPFCLHLRQCACLQYLIWPLGNIRYLSVCFPQMGGNSQGTRFHALTHFLLLNLKIGSLVFTEWKTVHKR